ncbi:hypothetical protein SLEP1_g50459 [Rubroshorea leprosula]|uniref:Uncharacterized protein n=1 Tax=Rubroshorea leprosula TaxID=152421 RepID=A0AAV5M0A9_9ROSI|nr:hypothetical protein SLEP1_g50459 [Rubroshorea leprosula]
MQMTSTKLLLNLNDVYHALIIIQASICLFHFRVSALPFSPLQPNKKQAADSPPFEKPNSGSALLCFSRPSATLACGCDFSGSDFLNSPQIPAGFP